MARAALQWLGKQAGFRAVVVTLCPATCSLLVSTGRGNPQKAVVMQRFAEVPVWLSNNKRLNLLLLHFRNDCDIVSSGSLRCFVISFTFYIRTAGGILS